MPTVFFPLDYAILLLFFFFVSYVHPLYHIYNVVTKYTVDPFPKLPGTSDKLLAFKSKHDINLLFCWF